MSAVRWTIAWEDAADPTMTPAWHPVASGHSRLRMLFVLLVCTFARPEVHRVYWQRQTL